LFRLFSKPCLLYFATTYYDLFMFSIKEDWIHWIWSSGSFRSHDLCTTSGIPVQLLNRGYAHSDAGPDFPESTLRLGPALWAGSVELHVKASDWNKHGHQHDEAYNTVILHVVWEHDADVQRQDGTTVPCLVLKPLVDPALLDRLSELYANSGWLACSGMLSQVPTELLDVMRNEALTQRMLDKSAPLLALAKACNHDWEWVLYQTLGGNFGFRTNGPAFAQLTSNLDYRILLRHRHNPFQLEALLFGQSGLLQGQKDAYARRLGREYAFLQHKYGLQPMQAAAWKFLRMRPLNFPTLRIAQFAALMQQHERLFDRILNFLDADELLKLFDVAAEGYWEDHYRFGLPSPQGIKRLGSVAGLNILVNTAAPIMFAYGLHTHDQTLMNRAKMLLEALPPENNRIIRNWAAEGVTAAHAAHGQALTGQWKRLCASRSCLQCAAGRFLAGGRL
jgi:hypothetical protein